MLSPKLEGGVPPCSIWHSVYQQENLFIGKTFTPQLELNVDLATAVLVTLICVKYISFFFKKKKKILFPPDICF